MNTYKKHEIIGVTGTNGSGKDTIGELLAANQNYLFISGSDMLREELKRRNLSTERINTRTLSAEWRRQYGLGVLIQKALDIYEQNKAKYNGLVIASLRNSGEAEELISLNGTLVWVDADSKLRYDRVTKRSREDDKKTYEQFLSDESDEMHSSGDKATLDTANLKEKAHIIIENNGNDKQEFYKNFEKLLGLTK